MLEPVSVGLKFGFLIVLYLFLVWVAWSVTRDLRRGRAQGRGRGRGPGPRPHPNPAPHPQKAHPPPQSPQQT
jgi:hypothetical protein